MLEYIKFNFKKLIFLTLYIFIGIALLEWLFWHFDHSKEEAITFELFYSFSKHQIFISVFTSFAMFIQAYLKYRREKKLLTSYPVSEIMPTVFSIKAANENSKWQYTEIYLAGRVNGYQVTIKCEGKELRVSVQLDLDQLTDAHVNELERQLGEKVGRDWLGIECAYMRSELKNMTHQEIEADLNHIIQYLKSNKIEPWLEDL